MAEKSATHDIAIRAERILHRRGAEAAHRFILRALRQPAKHDTETCGRP